MGAHLRGLPNMMCSPMRLSQGTVIMSSAPGLGARRRGRREGMLVSSFSTSRLCRCKWGCSPGPQMSLESTLMLLSVLCLGLPNSYLSTPTPFAEATESMQA